MFVDITYFIYVDGLTTTSTSKKKQLEHEIGVRLIYGIWREILRNPEEP